MLCQNCGKNEANIRYTQIINGVKKEIALCSECARKLGMDKIDIPINFSSFLGDFFNDYAENQFLPSFKNSEPKCKKCGMTYDDFIDTGMFGCSECYDTFANPIDSLLKNLHGTAKHVGRKPKKLENNIEEQYIENNEENNNQNDNEIGKEKNSDCSYNNKTESKELQDLKKQLEKAIKDERYEDAAKLRDKIKEMKK